MAPLPVRSSGFFTVLFVVAMFAFAAAMHAQVFVVGEKTATADVTTEFHPTHVEIPTQPLDERGRLDLIRNLESEQGFAHRELPFSAGVVLIANGNMTPSGEEFKKMLYQKGQAAGPGDRVQITSLKFEANRLVIDFDGGPYAKNRFLSHISINDMPIAYEGPVATGFRITLVFEGGLPDVSAAEVKALLDPIIDFKARSAAEAFANTLAPKVRDAVERHRVLVGMNKRTVVAAMGEPQTKHREHTETQNANSPVLEEWIYGQPPQATEFVRFRNGKVVRLEIAAIGKPIEVHDKNEVDDAPVPSLLARTIVNGDAQVDPNGDSNHASRPPTLMKPGEQSDDTKRTEGKVRMPADDPEPQKIPPPPGQPSQNSTLPIQQGPPAPGSIPMPGGIPRFVAVSAENLAGNSLQP
jgi:hypothetical protein